MRTVVIHLGTCPSGPNATHNVVLKNRVCIETLWPQLYMLPSFSFWDGMGALVWNLALGPGANLNRSTFR